MRCFRSTFWILVGTCAPMLASACNRADAASDKASTPAASTPLQGAGAPATVAATVAAPVAAPPAALAGGGTNAADSLGDSLLIAKADRGRLMGRDSGAIWVVMISDFQCPYCRQWHDASMESVKRDYVNTGRVRLAYLNLPLPQHKFARAEAEASMCAAVQNQFWPFASGLFQRQGALSKIAAIQPMLDTLARSLSLNMPEFGKCQKREAIRALVESDAQQAGRAGVRSTPSFLVGDFLVEGAVPYADFRKAIDTALVLAQKAKRSR